MQPCTFTDVVEAVTRQLQQGVFLSVAGQPPNVMTVGWGGITYFWRNPVFIAPIRPQRFTYPLLKETGEFTISVPEKGLQNALARAGSLSGRDGDKFAALGLTPAKAQFVQAPIVAECPLHLECRVLATSDFTKEHMDERIQAVAYPVLDFHTLFFGEIVGCYRT